MYDTTSEPRDNCASHFEPVRCGSAGLPQHDSVSAPEPAGNNEDTHVSDAASGAANFVERWSRNGVRASLPARRSRLFRQDVSETGNIPPRLSIDASERGSLTPAMRKRYLKDLLKNNPSHSGLSNVLSSSVSRESEHDTPDCTDWALYPMEHAWMLSAVDGNYEIIMDFISEDPYLLSKKDFVSGYTVLHWLAKSGRDDTLIKLLRHAEKEGIPVDVNSKGSAGFTPLHVAAMHSQYMVIKILVGAFSANVDVMDHSGRRAWQYLKGNAPMRIKELLGAWDDDHISVGAQNMNNSAAHCPAPENEPKPEVDSFDRTRRAGSWRFGSLKKWFPPLSYFGSKT